MSEILIAVSAVGSITMGIIIGYFLRKQIAQARANSVEARAEKMIGEAKNKEKQLLLQAKEKAIKVIDDAKKEEENVNFTKTLRLRRKRPSIQSLICRIFPSVLTIPMGEDSPKFATPFSMESLCLWGFDG